MRKFKSSFGNFMKAEVDFSGDTITTTIDGTDTLDVSVKVIGGLELEIKQIKDMSGKITNIDLMTFDQSQTRVGFIASKGVFRAEGVNRFNKKHIAVIQVDKNGIVVI